MQETPDGKHENALQDESITVMVGGKPKTLEDVLANGGGGTASVKAADITDASDVGRSVLTAKDAAAARTAIGAGTSSLALGTTKDTALAGDTVIPAAPAAATKDKAGLVKQGAAVAGAAGDTPTKAEFAALLKSLSDAGILAAS